MTTRTQSGDWEPFAAYLSTNPYVPSEDLGASLDRRTASPRPLSTGASEAADAIGNAVTLGLSLSSTLLIGFAVMLIVPRWLSPDRWGAVRGAEAMMALTLSFIAFGFDTYIRKEVAVSPGHAREFLPSVILFRLVSSVVAIAIALAVLARLGKPRLELALALLFGLSKFLLQTGELFAACLHAIGSVTGIRRITLPTKLLWAVLVLGGLKAGVGPIAVPAGWVVAEGVKTVALGLLARQSLRLRFRPTPGSFAPVMRASVPFSAGIIVAGGSMFLDVTIMRFLVGKTEVGYYGASQNLASLAFAVGPLIPWVLMPLASKAAARSTRELYALARRAFEFAIVFGIPSAVLLALNADVVIRLVGVEYRPSIASLRVLALVLVMTYFITMASVFLQALGRAWVGVRVAIVGVAISAVLNLVLQPHGVAWFGLGGAGVVAGFAAAVNEVVVAGAMLFFLGRRAWDDGTFSTLARVVAASVPVVLVDRLLAGWGFSWLRLFADVVVYGLNLVLLRAIDVSLLSTHVRSFRSKGRNA
jgi:O-antigen/teichoic acid export membrane protein